MNLETLKQWWDFATPIAPYLGVIVLVYVVMRNGINPMIKSHRSPRTNHFQSKAWYYVRRARFAYPSLLGLAFGEASALSGQDTNLFWCAVCGAAAQWAVDAGRDWAKSKGYDLPSGVESEVPLLSPEETRRLRPPRRPTSGKGS